MSAPPPWHALATEWCALARGMEILPPIPDIAEWVRAQRVTIGSENTTYQGDTYDFDRFPVVSRLIFRFFQDPLAKELFLLKPTQTAATTAVVFCLGHGLVFRGGNAIFVMHDREGSRSKVKDDVSKILRAIPAVGQAEEDAANDTTAGAMRFSTGILSVGSAGSVNVLASIPAYTVVLDESELHPLLNNTTSINRARERLTGAIDGGKLIALSKPEDEAVLEQDERTRQWKILPTEKTHLHSEYLSGNQLRYECQCPHCEGYFEPEVSHLMFHQANEALPGLPPAYNFSRVLSETYWQCPGCKGHVTEGPQKEAWVMNGRWSPPPLAERAGREIYPHPIPGIWSARFSALTDLAFPSQLSFGRIALLFIKAKDDPSTLRSFRNRIEGKPWARQINQDTTLDHLRRLIPASKSIAPPPWRMRDENGDPTGHIPDLSTRIKFVAATFDTQNTTLKFSTRAHCRDGSTYLLDYGELPFTKDGRDLLNYLDTARFRTMDGTIRNIGTALIDPGGHHYKDVMMITTAHPRLYACRGEGMVDVRATNKGAVWETRYTHTSGKIPFWSFDAPYWEQKLYVDCLQKFDPERYRWWAPALWMPSDVSDEFMLEHTRMHEVLRKGRPLWERINRSDVIDYGDTSKMHLILWWIHTGRHITDNQNRRTLATHAPKSANPKPRPKIA